MLMQRQKKNRNKTNSNSISKSIFIRLVEPNNSYYMLQCPNQIQQSWVYSNLSRKHITCSNYDLSRHQHRSIVRCSSFRFVVFSFLFFFLSYCFLAQCAHFYSVMLFSSFSPHITWIYNLHLSLWLWLWLWLWCVYALVCSVSLSLWMQKKHIWWLCACPCLSLCV